jgi:predicted phage terminase large subunit-like protein
MPELSRLLTSALETPSWTSMARPAQLPPEGDWRIWLLLGGRGAGKTLAAAQYVRAQVEAGLAKRIAVVCRTAADIRDVAIEGVSGLLTIAPAWCRPNYEPSKRRLSWPNGVIATLLSADEPDLLRGHEFDTAWADELAAWTQPQETWDMLMFTLRGGTDPRCVVSTTPRPIPLIRDLVKRDGQDVRKTHMTTYENLPNLAPGFARDVVSKYAGTWLGRQELLAEIVEDRPGALWTHELITETRVTQAPDLVRIVVVIDPATTATRTSDETGIVVAGLGTDGHYYVIADASCKATPDAWARRAIAVYQQHRADRIIAETNNGGEMVELILRTVDPSIPYEAVSASRGKLTRAEPVSALFEQHRAHLVGAMPELEAQLCTFVPGEPSPDRLDALMWAISSLLESGVPAFTRAQMAALIDPDIEPLHPEAEVEGFRDPEELAAELEAAFDPTPDDDALPKVTIEFLFQYDQWNLHDRVDVSPAEAAAFVKAGVARYATGPALSRLSRRPGKEP